MKVRPLRPLAERHLLAFGCRPKIVWSRPICRHPRPATTCVPCPPLAHDDIAGDCGLDRPKHLHAKRRPFRGSPAVAGEPGLLSVCHWGILLGLGRFFGGNVSVFAAVSLCQRTGALALFAFLRALLPWQRLRLTVPLSALYRSRQAFNARDFSANRT